MNKQELDKTKITYEGHYAVRALKEGEAYFCAEGCGVCEKKTVEETTRTMHDPSDSMLLERSYQRVDVSSCCGELLAIWDNVKDEEASSEYIFIKASEE